MNDSGGEGDEGKVKMISVTPSRQQTSWLAAFFVAGQEQASGKSHENKSVSFSGTYVRGCY